MRFRARMLALTVCAAVVATLVPPPASAQEEPFAPRRLPPPQVSKFAPRPQVDEGTVLVKYRKGASQSDRAAALKRHRAEDAGPVGTTGYRVARIHGRPQDAVSELESDPLVEDAEPNYIRTASAVPNDPAYAYGDQDYLKQMRMGVAWDVTKGTTAKTIAILDTGIDLDHPEFSGRRRTGYNAFTNGTNVADDSGHGTVVAGIAAAATNNGRGIAGAAWNAGILPVKVMNANGEGTDANIAEGITWAVDHGATVLNLSLGGPGASAVLKSAVDYALSRDRVVVVAAGNEGSDVPSYPAAYKGVLAVTATDAQSNFAWFSNHGWWVDVAAPGMGIVGPINGPGEEYVIGDGTSFAAPLVAGVAFLVRVKNPTWTQSQVLWRIRSTSRDMGPSGIDPFYGQGRIDAAAALGSARLAPVAPAPGDAREPDDVPARAAPLTSVSIATIAPEGDRDWHAVDVEVPGQLTLRVNPSGYDPETGGAAAMDPILEVFGPGLELLGRRDAAFIGEPETLTVPTPVAGRYYVRITNYFGSRSNAGYLLELLPSTPVDPVSAGPVEWIRSVTPPDLAQSISTGVSPTVGFARNVDPASVTDSTVVLFHGASGAVIPATVTYDAGTRTATIDPDSALAPNAPYVIFVWLVTEGEDIMAEAYLTRFKTA